MKKTILALAALAAGLGLRAEDAAPASSYSVTMDFTYASKYVFRGVKLADQSFQGTLKATAGSFYSGLWTNQPITDNTDNEIDFFAGYSGKLNDQWTIDAGVTVYYYPELDASTGADSSTNEGYVGFNGTFGGFTTGLYGYYDFTLEAFTLQGTAGYSIAMDAKASLNLLATLGHVDPKNGDSYNYYGIGATIPYKLNDAATFTVGVQWVSHDIDWVDDNHLYFTAGFTVTF
jgi:uncharacterized protein (TIGR02001 family)